MTLKTNELSIPNIRAQTRIIIHILQKISEMVVGNFLSHLDKARFKMLRSQAPKQE